MNEFRYTFVTEGSSDKVLIPILTWLLRDNGVEIAIQSEWADLGEVRFDERISLPAKIRESIRLYPCDLLFVHRDVDNFTREKRVNEISEAIEIVRQVIDVPFAVCVVPVRMQEAWLLVSEEAIRYAAGNGNGRQNLELPPIHRLESLTDPKKKLYDLLKIASGLSGRRLKRFRPNQAAGRIADFMNDYSLLRMLPAFSALESELINILREFNFHD